MTSRKTLRQVGITLMLLVTFLVQGTWALAGTTGGLSGNVTGDKGAAIAGASVTAASPSGSTTTTTDASGHFVFLSLAPDTYTVSMTKTGFQPISLAGITVFADQTQTLEISTHSALKEIGSVTSRSSSDLVKSGTTSDIYSVNAATAEKVAAIGGGTNLNNAYSALASQPGVLIGYGGYGWGQTVFIHGASYSQVGYEFDGVPVNRAFDNYNANTLSNLGQQELQVVTGGAGTASSSSTVGGFINQVIRTGTYPGFGNVDLGIGGPNYYHNLKFEAGGATPNRLFSYYVGISGYDETQRVLDQFDGGSGAPNTIPNIATPLTTTINVPGVYGFCTPPAATPAGTPGGITDPNAGTAGNPGCVTAPFPFDLGGAGILKDREAVANFHIGIPHKHDGGRDDIQVLYSGSFQFQTFKDSINDQGGYGFLCSEIAPGAGSGANGACLPSDIHYRDTFQYPDSVQFGQVATAGLTPINYFAPSSPSNRLPGANLDPNARGGQGNDSEIIKVQYQKNIGSNAYVRAYGYTFYSDWLLNDPNWGILYSLGNLAALSASYDYELLTHTRGGEIQFADQINSKNLLQLTGNATTASVIRFNNSTRSSSSGALTTSLLDAAGNCHSYKTDAVVSCFSATGSGTFKDPVRATACAAPAVCAGITDPANAFRVTFSGIQGAANTVQPKFSSLALNDEYRPTDKLLFNIGARLETFEYDLASSKGADYNFWFKQAANSYCYDPAAANAPVFGKVPGPPFFPGSAPLIVTAPGAACPNSPISGLATLHPNGTVQNGQQSLLYSNASDATVTKRQFEPRFAGTYTFSPDTVARFSIGKYANPFNTATVQYLNASAKGAATFDYTAFWGLGFTTPEHNVNPSVSTNIDASLEHHVKGTDISYKVSPFYRYVTDQTQDTFIGPGFVSAIPTGNETAYGLEAQISKGDPNRNGLSGQLSYTYTKARMKFNNLGSGQNVVDPINANINAYNALTATGNVLGVKGSPCYDGSGTGAAAPAGNCVVGANNAVTITPAGIAAGNVINPYYSAAAQPLLDRGASYPLYQTFVNPNENTPFPDQNGTIVWPQVVAGYLNWKHDKFSITPNFQLIQGFSGGSNGGGQYGSPLTVTGLDPRSCAGNQAVNGVVGAAAPTAGYADYTNCSASQNNLGVLYIPNPQTGKFDSIGQFQNPWLLNMNVQMKYELSNRVNANLVLANVYNRCFGGDSKPWTAAAPPGNSACGYNANPYYVGNQPGAGFFNGASPSDPANPWAGKPFTQLINQSYQPLTSFLPFSAYLTFHIKF